MPVNAECLLAKDCNSWGILSNPDNWPSLGNNTLSECGSVKLVDHYWLAVLFWIFIRAVLKIKIKENIHFAQYSLRIATLISKGSSASFFSAPRSFLLQWSFALRELGLLILKNQSTSMANNQPMPFYWMYQLLAFIVQTLLLNVHELKT